jgi:hypothetical protein
MPGITNQLTIGSSQRNAIDHFFEGTSDTAPLIGYSTALVGAVRVISITWTAITVNIAGSYYPVAAGSIALNAVDVVNPTTYYVYVRITNGLAVVERSTTSPESDPTIDYNYAWIAITRVSSNAGVAIVYYLARSAIQAELFAHFLGEFDYYRYPLWVEGGAVTVDAASGEVDMEALEYRRFRFEGERDAIANGALLLDSEAIAYANLELITTYADGSAITAGKYHKMLLGLITSSQATYPFIIMRQGLPTVEYATLAAAVTDDEHVGAAGFPSAYLGRVFPLAYVAMKLGDASDLQLVDLRITGLVGSGGGGGGGIADHGLLAGLGDDDHGQYVLEDGTRAFSGDIDLGTNDITNVGDVDGVDISVHAADPDAHHNQSHVLATNLALGPDHTVAGAAAGQVLRASGAAAANFQALVSTDITDFTEAAQDAVGAAVATSTTIALTYSDAGNAITGALRMVEAILAVVAGDNNNVVCSNDFMTISADPGAAFTLTGIAGGADGRRLVIYNATARNMTISNENAGSLAANRILSLGGASATTGPGVVELIYSASATRWILISLNS